MDTARERGLAPFIFIVAIGLIIIFALIIAIQFLPKTKQLEQAVIQKIAQQQTPSQTSKPIAAPAVHFAHYTGVAQFPQISHPIVSYTLKDHFSVEEVATFAQHFGLQVNPASQDTKMLVATNFSTTDNIGIMQFNTITGAFTANLYGSVRPSNFSAGQSSQDEAAAEIKDLGLADPTLSCAMSYKRKDAPGVTFAECHRDWQKLGLPLVDVVGLANLPERASLTNARVGQADSTVPDSAVYQTNTHEDGLARPNDFNTITIGFRADGSIQSIASSLRWLNLVPTPIAPTDLTASNDAYQYMISHTIPLSITLPAGSGKVDWAKIYPNQQATAQSATVSDAQVAYLEQSRDISQATYEPYYILRGTATLTSGYPVRFVQAIPALKAKLALQAAQANIAGVMTEIAQAVAPTPVGPKNLQIGTFDLPSSSPQASGTPNPSASTSPPPSSPPGNDQFCTLADQTGQGILGGITLSIPGYGDVTVQYNGQGGDHTYFIVKAPTQHIDLTKVTEAFFKAVEDQYVINVAKAVVGKTFPSTQAVHDYFRKINGSPDGFVTCVGAIGADHPAPVDYCSVYSPEQQQAYQRLHIPTNGGYDQTHAAAVADHVASRIYSAIQSNTIASLANQPDIFHRETMAGTFHLVFFVLPDLSRTADSCYISGASPSLFLYPQNPMTVTVTTGAPISYADPALTDNQWQVLANPNGTLTSPMITSRTKLYYEYDKTKIRFNQPATGFLVSRDQLAQIVSSIASQLQLTQAERQSLLTDAKQASAALTSPYIRIGLIDQTQLDQELPLTISPQPTAIYRINLLLTPGTNGQSIQAPIITPVARHGFTVVEVGAVAK